jgi:hypothetical protein
MIPSIRWKRYEDLELSSWEKNNEQHDMSEEELIEDQKKRYEDYLEQGRKEFVIPYNDPSLRAFDLYHFLSFGLNIPIDILSTFEFEVTFTKEEWEALSVKFIEPTKFV